MKNNQHHVNFHIFLEIFAIGSAFAWRLRGKSFIFSKQKLFHLPYGFGAGFGIFSFRVSIESLKSWNKNNNIWNRSSSFWNPNSSIWSKIF
jgi:hypothetical protein